MRKVLSFALLLVLLATAPALAATQTRRPTGDNSSTGTWVAKSGGSYFVEVNEATADGDGSYIDCTSTGRNLFNFPVFSVPAGATIQNLTVYFSARRVGGPADLGTTLLIGGIISDEAASLTSLTNSYPGSPYSHSYSNNPKTGVAWTTNEVNGLQAFGIYTTDTTPRCTQVYAVVTYTVSNSPPIGGYTSDNVIPAAQCTQSTDGNGIITINFRVKDANLDSCTLKTFQYSVDGGGVWNAPNNGDASLSLSSGWTNNSGSNYTSAVDFTGPVYSFTFNTKHADVSGINGTDQDDIRIRFTVNDGALDSTSPAASENFTVDDLNPAKLVTTEVTLRPDAGDTTVTLTGSFTERHPNTNTFYVAINGPAYGSGSAGDTNTATPSAHAVPTTEALDGNDYISRVRCVHVDDFGNSGTNENLAPSTSGVKPYTPAAPTVDNAQTNTVDVTVNKNASEADTLSYAIYESTTGQYVQADGSLGASEVWQTRAAWGTKTVINLTPPVSSYVFQTKSRNPNGDNPQSDLSSGASSGNSAPTLHNGSAENVLVVPVQATDGLGDVTITFRIKDFDEDACSVVSNSFYYQVNGAGWNPILDVDITGTKTGLSSAADLSGTLHTLIWNSSKNYIDDALSPNVQLRFKVNDGSVDSAYGVSPLGFNVDNLDPATLTATDIYTQPLAGSSTVTLLSSFTEANPNTNTFYVAINGGAYGSGTAGEVNTATPSPQATAVGATLDGNDYVNKVKCTAVDDFGNSGENENLNPDTAKRYVKPYIPSIPTVSNGTDSTVDVKVNKHPNEVSGLEYAIYVSSHGKYVQTDGTLGDTAAWQAIFSWGTKTVTGLTSPVSNYYFKTKSRNPSDAAHQSSSESDLSDPVNTTGVPATAEGIVSHTPAAGAEGVSPEAVITVTFDRDMDTGSINGSVFSMKAIVDHLGSVIDSPVSGSFSWERNRILTFTPAASLSKGYTYRVIFSGAVRDYDYNDLTVDLTWTFRVILDREISNIFYSRDGQARVVLALDAISNDASIDINRDPITSPKEVDPSKITQANSKVLAEGDQFFYPLTSSLTEINAYGIDDVRITDPFSATVTVSLYYDDENNDGIVDGTSPPIQARGLVMYRLDETHGLWVRVPGSSVDLSAHCVCASVPRFYVFTLMATPTSSLKDVRVFPNPYKPNAPDFHTTLTFTNISSDCTIKVFTLTGDLVKTIRVSGGAGQATWDVKNEAGESLASGLYLFVITSADDKKSGKFAVIR